MLRRILNSEYRANSGLAYPADWLVDSLAGARTYSGKRVTVQNVLGVSAVYAAVSYIAGAVSQCPLKVYKTLPDDQVEAATSHRAWRMLHDKPNPVTPASHHWSTTVAQILLWGNSFQLKERGPEGLVESLWLLDPTKIMVEWNPATRVKRYQYTTDSGQRITYSEDEILHLYDLSIDGVVGCSPVGYCRQMLATAMARDEFEGSFYQRGAVMSGVIEHPKILGEEGLKNLKTSFNTIYGGSAKAFQTGVLEEGATFKSMGMPLEELQFIEAQQSTRTDVAVMFKIPPSYLGGSSGDSLTYATVEGNQVQFASHAVAAPANAIAQGVSADPSIFPFGAWYAEFVLEGLMRGDHGSRASFYKTMSDIKAITVNEIRARENLPAVPWGDDPPVPPHLPTAEAIAEAGDAPPGAPPVLPPVGNGKPANGKVPPIAAR